MNYLYIEPFRSDPWLEEYCKKAVCMACFNDSFLFGADSSEMYIWNFIHHFGKSVETCRAYCAVCYDEEYDCFWSVGMDRCHIYRLSADLCETKCIDLCSSVYEYGKISAIACSGKENLLIGFASSVVEITKTEPYEERLVLEIENGFILALSSFGNDIVVAERGNCSDRLSGYSKCGCGFTFRCLLPEGCRCRCLAASSNGCGNELFIMTECSKCCPTIYCGRLYQTDCCKPLQPCCDEACSSDCVANNTCDIIQSVALEQAALSHILNAEGEKIQKAVCISDNICELLKVNASVNETISRVTQLEQLLLKKLELAKMQASNE